MISPAEEALVRRLERLESEARRLKRLGIVLASGACALLAGAAMRDPTVLVTEGVFIVDKDGHTRAWLGTTKDGFPYFSFRDEKGRVGHFMMQGTGGKIRLSLCDRPGKDRLRLGVSSNEYPYLTMHDERGRERVSLTALPAGYVGLSLTDRDDKMRASLDLHIGQEPELTFFDRKGLRLGVKLDLAGNPSLELFDKDALRGGLGLDDDQTARFFVKGGTGEGRAEVLSRKNGDAWLRVLDGKGEALFRGPGQ